MNGFSTGEEDSQLDDQHCCLIDDGERCARPAGNASYSKRIQRTVTQRKLRLNIDNSVHHIYICDYHKNMIQSARTKRRRKDSEDGDSNETDADLPEVDFNQLHVNTLKRYKNYHKLNLRPGFNKSHLVDSIVKHFKTIPVREKEILTYFIYSVKTKRNKLDLKVNSNNV